MRATVPLRRFCTCLDGKRIPLNSEERSTMPGQIPYWGANGVVDHVDQHLFDEELVLLGEDGAPFDDPSRDVAFRVEEKVWVNNHIHVLRPLPDVDARFLTYALNSTDWMPHVGGSTRLKLTQDDMISAKLPKPRLAEQRAIADYLDAETARIDALIAKKRQLIHLLEERWRVELTDGVAPDGVLATGGRWKTAAFGAVVRIAEGQVDPREHPWSETTLIAPNHIESGTGRLIERETAAEQGAISGKYRCARGDVIYSKIRPALVKAILAEEDCLCSADMYPLRPEPVLRPRFLHYLLLSPPFTEAAILESERVAMPKINRDALGRVRVPLPPLPEQDAIVDRLDRSRQKAEHVGFTLASQIDLLAEHRQALITAAVTGEFRVPGAA